MKVLGAILCSVGILIAGASGLCSLGMLVIGRSMNNGNSTDLFLTVSVFGGVPFAVGVAMFFAGRALLTNATAEAARNRDQEIVEVDVEWIDETAPKTKSNLADQPPPEGPNDPGATTATQQDRNQQVVVAEIVSCEDSATNAESATPDQPPNEAT